MTPALHTRTTVLPGRRLEILAPDLDEGEQVDVFVIPSNPRSGRSKTVLQYLDEVPPPGLFKTPADADRYVTEERDSWDR